MKTIRDIDVQQAKQMPDGFLWSEGCSHECGIIEQEAIDFAEYVLAEYLAQHKPMPPIERDEEMDRTYIPVHPNWEIQTKGTGSSFRIAKRDESGDRWLVCDSHLHAMLEEMARDIHSFIAPPIPAGMQLVNTRMNSTQRELMLRADEFTVDEMWIMLLAAKEK